jgi:hypothetical protein
VIQLIIQFRPELNVIYHKGVFHSSSAAIQPINDLLKSYPDAQIEALFTGDRETIPAHMRGYYAINLVDSMQAQTLQGQLQSQTSIEAAYIKPPAEMP